MRMAGISRQFVSSQSFRGEMARKRAASAGRSKRGSGVEGEGRSSSSLDLSMGALSGGFPACAPKDGRAVTRNPMRQRASPDHLDRLQTRQGSSWQSAEADSQGLTISDNPARVLL